jgi:hypothetical protein
MVYRFLGGPMPTLTNKDVYEGQGSTTQYSPFATWGPSTPVDNAPCIYYKFKTTTDRLANGVRWISLGTPSLMQISVTGGDPGECQDCYVVGTEQADCIDQDIINASPYEHTCNQTVSPGTGVSYETYTDQTKCTTINGEKVKFGEKEKFYNYCPSGNPTFCRGEIGNATIGYKTPVNPLTEPSSDYKTIIGVGSQFLCMYATNTGDLTMEKCDLSVSEQQFRVSRNNPGQTWSTYTYGESTKDTGLTGQNIAFYHRESGKFLYPEKSPDPKAPNETINLVLKDPDAITKGYVWAAIPQTQFSESANCQSFYGNKKFDTDGHPVKVDGSGNPIPYSTDKNSDYSNGSFSYNQTHPPYTTEQCINTSSKFIVGPCQSNCYSTCTFNIDTCLKKYCGVYDPTGLTDGGTNYEIQTCGIQNCDISSNDIKTIDSKCQICKGYNLDSKTGDCPLFDNEVFDNDADSTCIISCENDGLNAINACYSKCADEAATGLFNSDQRKPSPPQIIYIGDVFTKTLPTNAEDLYDFITANNIQAIGLDPADNTKLILQPFQTTLSVLNFALVDASNPTIPDPDDPTVTIPNYEPNSGSATNYAKDCYIKPGGTYCLGYTNPCDSVKTSDDYQSCMSYVQYDNSPQYSMPINFILYNTLSAGVPGS